MEFKHILAFAVVDFLGKLLVAEALPGSVFGALVLNVCMNYVCQFTYLLTFFANLFGVENSRADFLQFMCRIAGDGALNTDVRHKAIVSCADRAPLGMSLTNALRRNHFHLDFLAGPQLCNEDVVVERLNFALSTKRLPGDVSRKNVGVVEKLLFVVRLI